MSRFNSWVAEAMGESFLPKETTVAESPDRESNLEPYDYQADALATLLLPPSNKKCLFKQFLIHTAVYQVEHS